MSAGNVHDSHELPNLLRGEETRLYDESTYWGQKQRERLKQIAPKAKDFTNKLTLAILVRDEGGRASRRRRLELLAH